MEGVYTSMRFSFAFFGDFERYGDITAISSLHDSFRHYGITEESGILRFCGVNLCM
jgi:hypothetical protein